jgi:hypothetical protein
MMKKRQHNMIVSEPTISDSGRLVSLFYPHILLLYFLIEML